MNTGENLNIGFRVNPEQKREIWIEAAYAGVTASDFMKDAVMEKVAQARENRKKAEEEEEHPALAA